MPKLLRYFLFALLLMVVALVSALTTMRLAIHVGEVRVPNFRGKTPAEARRLADESGLVSEVETNYYSPTVAEGRVLSQGPAPGTIVRRGWEVQLALSLGPQRVTIPQVVGQSERAAGISIAERGLQLSSTDEVTIPGIDAGQVIAQNPPANSTDVSAPKIALLVARAPAPQAFVMPNFIGQPLSIVSNTLKDAGFSIGKVTVDVPESTPPSTPQAPAVGSQAAAGSVTSNLSPAPQTPSTASSTAPTQAPSAASIIVTQDPQPGHKVFAGATLTLTVR